MGLSQWQRLVGTHLAIGHFFFFEVSLGPEELRGTTGFSQEPHDWHLVASCLLEWRVERAWVSSAPSKGNL